MIAIRTGWQIDYLENMPSSTYQEVLATFDILAEGRVEEKPKEALSKKESLDKLNAIIREKHGN